MMSAGERPQEEGQTYPSSLWNNEPRNSNGDETSAPKEESSAYSPIWSTFEHDRRDK